MKKALLIISIFSLLLIGAKDPLGLIRFTVINKSEHEVAIRLEGIEDDELFYYLTIPEGDKDNPTIKIFTIQRDVYKMQVYYVATYDPVYGWPCPQPKSNNLIALKNLRINFGPCNEIPPNVGVPWMMKFSAFTSLPQKLYTCRRFANSPVPSCVTFSYSY